MIPQSVLEELLVLMGGRAAEKTFYDATTNGAAGDLDVARNIARKMIHEWGMGEKLYYEPEQPYAFFGGRRVRSAPRGHTIGRRH